MSSSPSALGPVKEAVLGAQSPPGAMFPAGPQAPWWPLQPAPHLLPASLDTGTRLLPQWPEGPMKEPPGHSARLWGPQTHFQETA